VLLGEWKSILHPVSRKLKNISSLNNLSVANQIHILEPQWNPAVESQAIGRVVRLGQQRQVRIIRYVMKVSVEKVSI
jgi:SNF2 family DNA or RNA helicase